MLTKVDWLAVAVAVIAFAVGVWMTGCVTSLMDKEPTTQTFTVGAAPEAAYQRAITTMVRMGGDIAHTDHAQYLVAARIHGAVALTVHVTPEGTESRVTVQGVLLPNRVVLGSMTEVNDYCVLYQQERAAHGR